jgi:hypothetical protein
LGHQTPTNVSYHFSFSFVFLFSFLSFIFFVVLVVHNSGNELIFSQLGLEDGDIIDAMLNQTGGK